MGSCACSWCLGSWSTHGQARGRAAWLPTGPCWRPQPPATGNARLLHPRPCPPATCAAVLRAAPRPCLPPCAVPAGEPHPMSFPRHLVLSLSPCASGVTPDMAGPGSWGTAAEPLAGGQGPCVCQCVCHHVTTCSQGPRVCPACLGSQGVSAERSRVHTSPHGLVGASHTDTACTGCPRSPLGWGVPLGDRGVATARAP